MNSGKSFKLLSVSILTALALAGPLPGRATDLVTDCSWSCASTSSCDQACYQPSSFSLANPSTCGAYGLCEGSTRYELEGEQPAEGYYDCWSTCTYVYGPGLQSCSYTQDGTHLHVACIY
jgi:hypothetical protein